MRNWLIPAVAALVLVVPAGLVYAHRVAGGNGAVDSARAERRITDPNALLGVNWQLMSFVYNGKPGTPDLASPAGALSFPDVKSIDFRADCNYSGGSATVSAGRIKFGTLMSTAMGCPARSAIPAMSAVLSAKTVTWWISGGDLTIRRDAQNLLVFRDRPAGQFPSDYPGSPRVEIVRGGGSPAFLFLYGRSGADSTWLGVEIRGDNDRYRRQGRVVPKGWSGPEPDCGSVLDGSRFFLYGPATANAATATLRSASTGQQLRLALKSLGSTGLQAYYGYADDKQTWTLTLRDEAGHVVGTPCTQPQVR